METFALWGAIVNALAIILGASAGLIIKGLIGYGTRRKKKIEEVELSEAEKLKKRNFSDTIMKGLGLCVLLIGVSGAVKSENTLLIIVSIVIGGLIGEALNLNYLVNKLGDKVEKATRGRFGKVAEGFVTASLLFCVGAMAIVGSLNSGISGDHSTLYAKSILDCVAAIIFASSLGIGVLFSSVLVFLFQGGITILAQWIAPFLTETVILEMSAVGSLIIVAVALNVMGITKIRVMNLVPAVFLPILLCMFM